MNRETFRQAVQDLGIQAALFDYDGTLADTNALFLAARDAFCQYCYEQFTQPPFSLHLTRAEFVQKFQDLDAYSYKLNHGGVDPYTRWHHLVPLVAQAFLQNKIGLLDMGDFLNQGLGMYERLYRQIPTTFTGAREVLTLCQEAGLATIVVTHAHEAWTDYKIEGSGLADVITKVYAVDVNVPKQAGWDLVFRSEGLSPSAVTVTGDSVASDMIPTASLGVQYLFFLANTTFFNAGQELPLGAQTLHTLEEFPDAVIRTWEHTRMIL